MSVSDNITSHLFTTSPFMVMDKLPNPIGLLCGLAAVALGQILVVAYFHVYRNVYGNARLVQNDDLHVNPKTRYAFAKEAIAHFAQLEGFVLLGSYLSVTWLANWMPASYYRWEGGVQWHLVVLQLLLQDMLQYFAHYAEHKVSATFYRYSHKPHHRFTNPKLFDAFNGSLLDTLCMILIPLYTTANLVHCNVWSYMAFGTIYSSMLTLIHSEYVHPWDDLFRLLGVGTAADHHVHHKQFVYNYGHIFTYWDRIFGTYRCPDDVRTFTKSTKKVQ
ncbi:alternative squalene epoxidase [Pseudoscourfieldia marina]